MLTLKPSIPTEQTPYDLYNFEQLQSLGRFIKAVKGVDPGNFEQAARGFSERELYAEMLQACRNIGFYPIRVEQGNKIVWGNPRKNRFVEETEKKGFWFEEPDFTHFSEDATMDYLSEKVKERFGEIGKMMQQTIKNQKLGTQFRAG